MLFNPRLPKEFIYGYYGIKIVGKKLEGSWIYRDFIYDNVLEFYNNLEFFGYLSREKQDFVLEKLFTDKKRELDNLKAANSKSNLSLLLKTLNEKYIIQETREQAK